MRRAVKAVTDGLYAQGHLSFGISPKRWVLSTLLPMCIGVSVHCDFMANCEILHSINPRTLSGVLFSVGTMGFVIRTQYHNLVG